jgi:hypothetical protein
MGELQDVPRVPKPRDGDDWPERTCDGLPRTVGYRHKYVCRSCGKSFRTFQAVRDHERAKEH